MVVGCRHSLRAVGRQQCGPDLIVEARRLQVEVQPSLGDVTSRAAPGQLQSMSGVGFGSPGECLRPDRTKCKDQEPLLSQTIETCHDYDC